MHVWCANKPTWVYGNEGTAATMVWFIDVYLITCEQHWSSLAQRNILKKSD